MNITTEMLRQVREGDREAWAQLYEEFKREVIGVCLAFDSQGNLLVLESGKGRILRIEPKDGEIQAGSPVSVLAEGFASAAREPKDITAMREERSEHLALELHPEERVWPVYLTVNEFGEIFIGGQATDGEAVVYKIGRKQFKWWKFYCLYRC